MCRLSDSDKVRKVSEYGQYSSGALKWNEGQGDFIEPISCRQKDWPVSVLAKAGSIVHNFKSDVHIAEMSGYFVGGLYVAAAQLSPPYYVVPGVEWEGYIESIAL